MTYYLVNIEDLEYKQNSKKVNAISEYSQELEKVFNLNRLSGNCENKINNYLKYYQLPRKVLLLSYDKLLPNDFNEVQEFLTGLEIRVSLKILENSIVKDLRMVTEYRKQITLNQCIGIHDFIQNYSDICKGYLNLNKNENEKTSKIIQIRNKK